MTTRPRSPSAIQTCRKISGCDDRDGQNSFTTTQPSSSQVCVALSHFRPAEGPYYVEQFYYLYILDPCQKDDSSTSLSLHPRNSIVQLFGNYPFDMAFIVVDSALYMFGGLRRAGGWKKASYSYDLSPHLRVDSTGDGGEAPYHLNFDSKEESRIETLPSMSSPKFLPRAVLVGGKICVFSTRIGACSLSFELYDLASRQWLIMPEPCLDFCDTEVCDVMFSGVENNWFYICTSSGSFRIDCGRPELQWEEIQDLQPCRHDWYENPASIVKDGNLLLSPAFTAYDMDNPTKAPRCFRIFDHSERKFYPRDRSILLLPKEDDERLRACIVEIGGFVEDELLMRDELGVAMRDGDAHFLRVSLIKFDDDDEDDDDTSLLNPTVLNARLFNLDINIKTFDIKVVGLFQM